MSYRVQQEPLETLAPEWAALVARSYHPCVFITPTWLREWWKEFADDQELLLLSVRSGNELVGVAPLMRKDGTLTFAGDTSICDYMDFTAPTAAHQGVLAAVMRSVMERTWDQMALWAVREDSPTFQSLPGVCEDLGLSFEAHFEDVCPRVELPATWDDYVEGLDKKDRHELRRKFRKLPQGGAVDLQVLEEPEEVAAGLDDFLRLHTAARSDKALFMTEQMSRFFRNIVSALSCERLIELTFLTLDGVRVAGVLCFRTPTELLLYNSGYDPGYAGLSVGLLSKALALRRSIEEGRKLFDFLRGAEAYKYDLGAQNLNVYRVLIRKK